MRYGSLVADAVVALAAVAAVLSALLTLGAIAYARRRQLVDLPGRRRSHAVPTARGGGIAIVLVLLAHALFQGDWQGALGPLAFFVGVVLVAAIGWIDDHRPLSARVRLLVHLVAAAVFVLALVPAHVWQDTASAQLLALLAGLAAVLWIATTINFWNFVDGSNGLVTLQTMWVAGVLAVWLGTNAAADPVDGGTWWFHCAVLAGAAAGFLPFNFPRARIFLGDVGSGALGFACGALLLATVVQQPAWIWSMLLVPSLLLGDAALTLLHRIVAGRRWYTAHREHLYQWLIRAGASHAQVAIGYLGWNLVVVLPALLAQRHWPTAAPAITVGVLGVTALAWMFGKRAVLRRVRNGNPRRRTSPH